MNMPPQQRQIQWNRTLLQFVGHLWASPYTLLGIILGGFGRSRCGHYGSNLEILLLSGPVLAVCKRMGISAFTLGDCVLYSVTPCQNLREHEGRHCQQYRLLGPFFLPLYYVIMAITGYWNHPLERDARLWELRRCGCLYSETPLSRGREL